MLPAANEGRESYLAKAKQCMLSLLQQRGNYMGLGALLLLFKIKSENSLGKAMFPSFLEGSYADTINFSLCPHSTVFHVHCGLPLSQSEREPQRRPSPGQRLEALLRIGAAHLAPSCSDSSCGWMTSICMNELLLTPKLGLWDIRDFERRA